MVASRYPRWIQWIRCRGWAAYTLAVASFALAFLFRHALDPLLPSGYPYLTFFPAVILTTFIAGIGPGLITAALSGLMPTIWGLTRISWCPLP